MREEEMAKALAGEFFHYVGKDQQLIKLTESERDPMLRTKPKLPPEENISEKMRRLNVLRTKKYIAGKYSFQRILNITCAVYGVSEELLLSASRKPRLVNARRQIVRIARTYRGLSYMEIGRRLNRDHSTIIHAFISANKNPEPLQKHYEEILQRLEDYSG